jgi:cytochrome P450
MATRRTGPLGDRTRTSSLGLRNVQAMLRRPLEHLRFLAEEHGDVVVMPMLSDQWLLLVHPEDIEALLVGSHPSLVRDHFTVYLRRLLGQGLLTSDGELWKRQRRLLSSAFTPKRIRGYASSMVEVTDRGLGRIEPGATVRLHEVMSRLTMEVVAEVLFGAGITEADVLTVSRGLAVMNRLLANTFDCHSGSRPRSTSRPARTSATSTRSCTASSRRGGTTPSSATICCPRSCRRSTTTARA